MKGFEKSIFVMLIAIVSLVGGCLMLAPSESSQTVEKPVEAAAFYEEVEVAESPIEEDEGAADVPTKISEIDAKYVFTQMFEKISDAVDWLSDKYDEIKDKLPIPGPGEE